MCGLKKMTEMTEMYEYVCMYVCMYVCEVRIGLTGRVANVTRDRVCAGVVLTALAHAGIVMSNDSSVL